MTIRYEQFDDHRVIVLDGRKNWSVDCPAYVYDIWYPLFGMEPVGVYNLLCRLARDGAVSQLGIKKFAQHCRIGKATWLTLTNLLCECGFIEINVSHREQREQGISTVYTVLDAPREIPADIFNKYMKDKPELYRPITTWFFKHTHHSPRNDGYPQPVPSTEDDELDPLVSSQKQGGGSIQNQGYVQPEPGVVLPGTLRFDPLFDPFISKRGPHLARAQDTGSASSSEPVPGNNGSDLAGTEKEGMRPASSKRSTRMAGEELQAELPKIAQLVIRTLTGAKANFRGRLTQEQIDLLTKRHVALKSGGGEMPFTVAELYDKYPVEFEAWAATIPATIDNQKKHLTPGNVIDLMRGFDWINVGFKAYLNARGDFSLPEGPSSPVPAEAFCTSINSWYTGPERILTEAECKALSLEEEPLDSDKYFAELHRKRT